MWVIYARPKDHPDGYIARLWQGSTPTAETIPGDQLEAVRLGIAERMPGAQRLGRQPGDDPVIVEVWL